MRRENVAKRPRRKSKRHVRGSWVLVVGMSTLQRSRILRVYKTDDFVFPFITAYGNEE